jgi:hypothetical protein|eukprot:COSAG02_NODE_131_length_34710_cov_17.171159_41_plen_62_part_00
MGLCGVRWVCTRYGEQAILFYELGNILDITLKGGLNVLAKEQGTTQGEQLEAALGSYTNCS